MSSELLIRTIACSTDTRLASKCNGGDRATFQIGRDVLIANACERLWSDVDAKKSTFGEI